MVGRGAGGSTGPARPPIIELENLRPVDPGFTETGSAIEQMCMQLREVVLRVRERSEVLGDLDAVSQR